MTISKVESQKLKKCPILSPSVKESFKNEKDPGIISFNSFNKLMRSILGQDTSLIKIFHPNPSINSCVKLIKNKRTNEEIHRRIFGGI